MVALACSAFYLYRTLSSSSPLGQTALRSTGSPKAGRPEGEAMKRGVAEGIKQHVVGAGDRKEDPWKKLGMDYETIVNTRQPLVRAKEQFRQGVKNHSQEEVERRRTAIRDAFKTSWNAYERDAFGFDNYHPIGRTGSNLESKGIGYFIIDGLDVLQLMGLDEEYARAREWIETELTFDVEDKHHAFETTIRVLGGLLAAYHLSEGDQLYLDKAVDLADRLLPIFDTPSGIPLSFINLKSGEAIPDKDNYNMSSVAEAGTLQLEFKYLSHLTGDPIYWEKVEKVMQTINAADKTFGLVPLFLLPNTGDFEVSEIRLGSRADSYYEYLLKQYLQTNRKENLYKEMYESAMEGIRQHLATSSPIDSSIWTYELVPALHPHTRELGFRRIRKQDHLVCFFGGLLMLGVTNGHTYPSYRDSKLAYLTPEEEDTDQQNWLFGEELIQSCMDTYLQSKTGLSPEIVNFYMESEKSHIPKSGDTSGRAWYINQRRPQAPGKPKPDPPIDARNILRPETVESLLMAWRLTHNPIYREWGWTIFQTFEEHCKIPTGGYASIRDVDELPVVHEDKMETFFLSETLKYLYLLYSDDDVLPLTKYVFNTEAHPLPVFTPDF